MIGLVVGAVLAAAALAFVLYPLFAGDPRAGREAGAGDSAGAPAPVRATEPASPEHARALEALREIEFEHQMGKLSDPDYERLRSEYAALADPASSAAPADDEAERFIRAYRARFVECPVCGPRPEPDARFCSTCGRFLAGACPRCGLAVADPTARYCTSCGAALAS